MQKWHMDEVPAPVVAFSTQCIEGVEFNWADYLCKEFLEDCKEAQEQRKTLHYA